MTGVIVLVLWQTIPAVRIVPHVIYLEWLACLSTFLLTWVFEREPMLQVELEANQNS